MMSTEHEADPCRIDPLRYLAEINGHHAPEELFEHYQLLRPALLRLQRENPPAFDVAVREITKRLKIKGKTILLDLAALTPPPATREAKELLQIMGYTRRLRLAQDFVDGKLWYGLIAGKEKLVLNSAGELLTLNNLPHGLEVKDHGFDLCRASKDAILRFLSGEAGPDPELSPDLQAFFSRFALFRDPRIPLLLSAWTLGTYCYRIFRVFPYLALRSPAKRCGKSRVLDELSLVAFNASERIVHPTEPLLFRAPSRNGGTLLLDEVEALGRADKDMYAGLLAVLNSGFEQGGSVPRLEKTASGNFREVTFETYCPRAIAGIHKLADTLEDRAIIVVMQRKLARERIARFSRTRLDSSAQALRDRCYLWALTHAPDLHEVYEAAQETFSSLGALDDRAQDLWEPLVAITAACDVQRADPQKTLTTTLLGLAMDLCQVREGAAEDSTVVQVVDALVAVLAQRQQERGLPSASDEVITLTPTELAALLKEKLGWETLSKKYLATLLTPLRLQARKTREGEKVIRAYHLKPTEITELLERYGSGDENHV